MIDRKDIYKIGVFNKPHGVNGELQFTFTDDIFDRVDCDFLICMIDGIPVPFFVEEYRIRSGTTALVKLDGVDDACAAAMFINTDVYFPRKYLDEGHDEFLSWNYFEGFKVTDVTHGEIGVVTGVDSSTANVLFNVRNAAGQERLIPVHEDIIESIDKDRREITFDLPDGLVNLDESEEV